MISLSGDKDAPRAYMLVTGMLSSQYESTIWEELTGYESVSTMSVLAKAQEENIDLLLLSKNNLDTEIAKLNTDETTKQTVINAVNSGKVVTIPAEDVDIDDWHGTGYIVMNPETGAGAYMISGGLNGGSSPVTVVSAFMVNMMFSVVDMIELMSTMVNCLQIAACALTTSAGVLGIAAAVISLAGMLMIINNMSSTVFMILDYFNGDLEAGEELIDDMKWNFILTIGITAGGLATKNAMKSVLKNDLIRTLGDELTERLLAEFGDVKLLSKCVKQLQKMNIGIGVIIETSGKFGKTGLEWILSKQNLGLTDDIVRKILKADTLDDFTDDVLRAIKNYNQFADDIIDLVKNYGKTIPDAISKYGDDAVEILLDYGDTAAKLI